MPGFGLLDDLGWDSQRRVDFVRDRFWGSSLANLQHPPILREPGSAESRSPETLRRWVLSHSVPRGMLLAVMRLPRSVLSDRFFRDLPRA
jgi:hypothetical protein